jgi:thiamine-monophosphate kinase
MAEFSIIEEFCHGIGPSHANTKLSVGDDAAIISIPQGMELAVSVDTMIADVHFYADAAPESIAHKIMAVNLSDMAAMGAIPKWATLTLSIPSVDYVWLKAFSDSLKSIAHEYNVQVIGGDTTQGPLNLSINIMGLLPKGKALCRHGAKSGDDVYVSHYLGDAALGLLSLQDKLKINDKHHQSLILALEQPEPRVELGQKLLSIATSCLDLSDGLIGDLAHICERSDVSINIDLESIPLSQAYKEYIKLGGDLSLALNGGDDYELAFTAHVDSREQLSELSKELGIRLSRIGRVVPNLGSKVVLLQHGKAFELLSPKSFEHFSN